MLKAIMIGHLGNDCSVNTVNGKQVINFNVAHSEKWKDSAGVNKEKTIWINCSWWNDSNNIASYLKKGTQVYVEGQPDVKLYTDNRGASIPQITLRVFSLQLLGGNKNNQPNNTHSHTNHTVNSDIPQQQSDDIPF